MSDSETPNPESEGVGASQNASDRTDLPDGRDPRFGEIEGWIATNPPELARHQYVIWNDDSGIFAYFASEEGLVFYTARPGLTDVRVLDRNEAYDKLFDILCEIRIRTRRKYESPEDMAYKHESLRLHEVMRVVFKKYIEDYAVEMHIRKKYGIKRSPTGTRRLPVLPK